MGAILIDLISIFLIKGTNVLAVREIYRGVVDHLDTKMTVEVPASTSVPEFPTVALPIISVLGISIMIFLKHPTRQNIRFHFFSRLLMLERVSQMGLETFSGH
jgi:hypothetical protein